MNKLKLKKKLQLYLLFISFLLAGFIGGKMETHAATFPAITLTFDATDQSVIVEGIPAYDSTGSVQYELNGYMNYQDERVETFCYAPAVYPHHIADKQAYIFNWTDTEFLLPCSGDYQFTAYVTAIYSSGGQMVEENGPKQTITITLTKKDESTNWGPGLPNTTVETYDLGQMQGKDKTILIEEDGYTWTINGMDINTVPDANLSLAITQDPENFAMLGVDNFFGNTLASKFSIEHSGDFGFTAILDYFLGTEYSSKYANLFYVIGDGTFEFMESVLVDEKGFASYKFTHASDYIIAVTDVEYTGQELNPKPEESIDEPETPVPEDTAVGPTTDSETADSETTAPTTNTDSTTTQTNDAGGKTESIFINPLFYTAIAVLILVIVFIVFTVVKKKRK